MRVGGIVLAAGGGRRFAASGGSGPKARASAGGVPLVVIALRAALDAGLEGVVVVQGDADLADLVPTEVTVLHNPHWADGLASSLQVGLAHARDAGLAAVVVGLADQPGVTAAAWRAVASAPSDRPIAVATYDGRRANPVRVAESVWSLLPVAGDEGARGLMRRRPELVREVPCSGEPHDVDTLEDLDRWS